jgi:hypothetical protein
MNTQKRDELNIPDVKMRARICVPGAFSPGTGVFMSGNQIITLFLLSFP